MTKDKKIKTVTAPALVVVETDKPKVDETEPTVLDTQKIKKLILEAARLVTAEESAKHKARIAETRREPPYLLIILLTVLLGFVAVIALVTLRPDLDFVIVSGAIFVVVTSMTTSIFSIMKNNQTLNEAREANIKSQLALVATKETHGLVNSQLDEFKKAFMQAEQERSKAMAAKSYNEGRRAANKRTDKLSGVKE